mgnify:CR=1 FL=1
MEQVVYLLITITFVLASGWGVWKAGALRLICPAIQVGHVGYTLKNR